MQYVTVCIYLKGLICAVIVRYDDDKSKLSILRKRSRTSETCLLEFVDFGNVMWTRGIDKY